jgi:NIMA (never in mitosis gene a)-related kinase 1/4/5
MGENLKQIKLLGEGAFGKCYLCENTRDGSMWVVKQIDISKMTPQEKREAYHEAKVMSAFDHPNIIKFKEVYTTTNGKLNILMNYADGGDLQSKIKAQRGRLFSENEILDIFVQICLAIKHVHDRKVLHRDIKGQNIFLMKNGMIKLGDFGISKVLNSTMDKARTMVGTPYYLSPEIVEGKPYSFKSDVWSLGVLLYELCTLKPPFDGTSIRQLGMNIVRGTYPPLPQHFSKDMKNLVSIQLTIDQNKRPTVGQMLKMPFIMSRIRNVLTESVRFQEFSHTIFHNQDLFSVQKKQVEIKSREEDNKKKAKEDEDRRRIDNRIREEEERKRYEEEIKKKELEQKRLLREAEIKSKEEELKKLEIRKKEIIKDIPRQPIPFREPRKDPSRERQIEVPKIKFNEIPPFRVIDEKQPDPPKKLNEIPPFRPIEERQNKKLEIKPIQINDMPKNQIVYKPPSPAVKYNPYIYQKIEDSVSDIKPVQKDNISKPEKDFRAKYEDLVKQREKEALEEKKKHEEFEKNKDAVAKKREEERKQMFKDIKKKKKQKKNKDEGIIQWVGDIKSMIKTEDQDQKRLYKVLQEAMAESSADEDTIVELPNEEDEEIIDREDKIGIEEEIVLEREKPELSAMRFFIEDHIGIEETSKAYKIAQELGDFPVDDQIIETLMPKFSGFMSKTQITEFLPLLQTLIFLESYV